MRAFVLGLVFLAAPAVADDSFGLGEVLDLAWSADGREIVVLERAEKGHGPRIVRLDAATRSVVSTSAEAPVVRATSASRLGGQDSALLVDDERDGECRSWRAGQEPSWLALAAAEDEPLAGAPLALVDMLFHRNRHAALEVTAVAVAPGGKRWAVAHHASPSEGHVALVCDVPPGPAVARVPLGQLEVTALALSPSGDALAVCQKGRRARVVLLTRPPSELVLAQPPEPPDGRMSEPPAPPPWPEDAVVDPSRGLGSIAFTADGQLVVAPHYSGKALLVWNARTGRPDKLRETDLEFDTVAFSPDGTRMAAWVPAEELLRVYRWPSLELIEPAEAKK
jgi:hypothetical protein